jgi:SAM-dependent methyltransferase
MVYKWDYLMTPEALPMFEYIHDIIKKHDCKSVLDIGCGYSRISDLLDTPVCGIDIDEDAISYCNENYPGEYIVYDCATVNKDLFSSDFDCIVLSGLLYYFKDGFAGGVSMTEYVNKLINEFDPKLIVVAEPQARADYNGPDYTEFLTAFTPNLTNISLDIRMGERIIYEIVLSQ